MTIDRSAFTPRHALAGSLLIGSAAVSFMLPNSRIAGIGGIVT